MSTEIVFKEPNKPIEARDSIPGKIYRGTGNLANVLFFSATRLYIRNTDLIYAVGNDGSTVTNGSFLLEEVNKLTVE